MQTLSSVVGFETLRNCLDTLPYAANLVASGPARSALAGAALVALIGLGVCAWRSAVRRRCLAPAAASVNAVPSDTPIVSSLANVEPREAHRVDKIRQLSEHLTRDLQMRRRPHLVASDVMTHPVASVYPDDSKDHVQKLMTAGGYRHVPVQSHEGRVVGIISDRDLRARHGAKAADIMTPDPVVTSTLTPICDVVTAMLQPKISCVPVVREGVLCGVITTTDMLFSLVAAAELLSEFNADSPVPELASSVE